jgi:hypothetical protein
MGLFFALLGSFALVVLTLPSTQPRGQRPESATAAMEHPLAPFRFLDLPKELRLLIYERLPRCIRWHEMCIRSRFDGKVPHQKLTVILRTVPVAMLSTCRQINREASAIVQGIAKRFILLQPPRLIFEAHDHFNEMFLFWILDAISEQAHRRVVASIRHTLDCTDSKFPSARR